MSVPARLLLLVAAATGASCGTSDDTADVLAASSFTDVAGPLETLLETELDIDVRFSFGSSASFEEQLRQGAPAAAVLTADGLTMDRLLAAGLVEAPVAVTTNDLVIVTADTPGGRAVETLADLVTGASADPPLVVLCASSAPCGRATDELLAQAGAEVQPVSREPNVRATLNKVALGEADAAIVYRTDALATPSLRALELPAGVTVTGHVAPIADRAVGKRIAAELAGPEAARLFADAGFGAP